MDLRGQVSHPPNRACNRPATLPGWNYLLALSPLFQPKNTATFLFAWSYVAGRVSRSAGCSQTGGEKHGRREEKRDRRREALG
jgi:hypothetical protein